MTARAVIDQPVISQPLRPHVLVIGGGIGGLTVAQGLKKSGVSVAVYERDRTPGDRLQGYRILLSAAGSRALHECLPPHLFAAFANACGTSSQTINFVTERMRVLISLDMADLGRDAGEDAIARHRSVSRITLREVLLSGLDETVHFGKTFVRYEELPSGRVVAHFADGTTAEGDVIVAADGGGSRVRKQLLPHAERVETGVVGIAGKVFLDGANRERIASELRRGATLASGKDGSCLFIALQELDGLAADALGRSDERASADAHFDTARSYLMWAFGTRRDKFGPAGNNLERMAGEELRSVVLETMRAQGWDQRFCDLVLLADQATINAITIRTALPVAPWSTRPITLLGDAIHSMTPYRGIGANVALKDAVRLCRALTAVHRGKLPLLDALHAYEAEMIEYGFRAVRTSLEAMRQAMPEGPWQVARSRAFLRAFNHVPLLKRRLFSGMGDE